LVEIIDAYVQEHGLRKDTTRREVFAPVPGCPCAYARFLKFAEFIPHVLRGNPIYLADVRRASEMESYLRKDMGPGFPSLELDHTLLSFSDGVVVLPEGRFVATPGGVAPPELEGRVAGHHIPHEYTASSGAPLMDALIMRQLGVGPDGPDELVETLYALIGRLLVPPSARAEAWDVEPVLVGRSSTGKSTLIHVVNKLFSDHSPVLLDSRRIVHEPRLAMFEFGRPVKPNEVDTTLPSRIVSAELPAIVTRCLGAYLGMVEKAGGRDFWAICPPSLVDVDPSSYSRGWSHVKLYY
jgi:hypothetical protein